MNQQRSSPSATSPSGGRCLLVSGILLTVAGAMLVLFGLLVVWISMDSHDEHLKENEAKLEAYYADSAAINAHRRDLTVRQEKAWAEGDTLMYNALTDSLLQQPDYPSDLYVGFPIGAAFGMAIAVVGSVPLVVGVVLLFVYRSKQKKARQQAVSSYPDV